MKRIIIAGASSHSGKTTVACGLLASLKRRGLDVIAYKTGPDYIDPEYLRRAGGCEAYNLDTWLMSEDMTRKLFALTSYGHDTAIIEGAMGLYDGGVHSTAGIARLLNAPVILVINAKSSGESAAAIALGFREYDPRINFAGVILNCTGSDFHEKIIADSLADKGIKFLGALRRDDDIAIHERHLGLVSAYENGGFDVDALRAKFESCVNVDEVMRIAENASPLRPCGEILAPEKSYDVRIGVARDEAFTFRYPESIHALEAMGAEITYFSPIHDDRLPEADGYIFGGGFPEIFAESLASNASMIRDVRECAKPLLAECGGMMYLCRSMKNLDGRNFIMAGVIPFESYMAGRAVMGYMTARALRDNLLCAKGESVRGHEFHYSRVIPEYIEGSCAFEMTRRNNGGSHFGGYSRGNVLASYLHVNFFGNDVIASRFMNVLASHRIDFKRG